jgi:hypothetical protein
VFTVAMIAIARKVVILDKRNIQSHLDGDRHHYYRSLSRILSFKNKAGYLMQDHAYEAKHHVDG